jgi:hypothetical protein
MTDRGKSALVMVSLAVVAVVSAPAANARPDCQTAGVQTICQTNGSVSIKVAPGTVAPPGNMPLVPWNARRGTQGAGAGGGR